MERLRNVKENIANKLVKYKAKLEIFLVTLLALFSTSTYAYADINGETMKNNVINNFLIPICVVVICIWLIKELIKKSMAGVAVVLLIGGFILVILYSPDLIKVFGDTIKSIFGL